LQNPIATRLKDNLKPLQLQPVSFLNHAPKPFLGKDWIGYLSAEPKQRFRIRIRESKLLKASAKTFKAAVVFAHLQPHQTQILKHRRCLWGHWLFIAGLRLEDG
jgi:hypothetical protein